AAGLSLAMARAQGLFGCGPPAGSSILITGTSVGLGALSPASRSCSEPGAFAAGAALASDGWALALEPLDCFEAGEELLEGITSSWPGWIFLGSVMLLVTAMSPCLTPYLRAIP